MPEPTIRMRMLRDDEPLPAEASPVFDDARAGNLFYSRAWLECYRRHGVPPGDRLQLHAMDRDDDGTLLALLPAVFSRLYEAHPRARVLHFLQPEALAHMPLFSRADAAVPGLETLMDSLRVGIRPYDVLRFSPLRPGAPVFHALESVLRRSGHALQVYRLAPEYYASTPAATFAEFLAARPAALRERLDQGRAAHADAGFRLVCDADGVDDGLRDYCKILDANESDPESEPSSYLPNVMRVAAQCGALRLGILYLGGQPAAIQLWMVSGGRARCLRAWSVFSRQEEWPDDLLSERILAHLIDIDRVGELSYGALDDGFIGDWADAAREQFGLAAFNLRTWRGLKGTLRHVGADALKSVFRRAARR